jgi:hypothetical protein
MHQSVDFHHPPIHSPVRPAGGRPPPHSSTCGSTRHSILRDRAAPSTMILSPPRPPFRNIIGTGWSVRTAEWNRFGFAAAAAKPKPISCKLWRITRPRPRYRTRRRLRTRQASYPRYVSVASGTALAGERSVHRLPCPW